MSTYTIVAARWNVSLPSVASLASYMVCRDKICDWGICTDLGEQTAQLPHCFAESSLVPLSCASSRQPTSSKTLRDGVTGAWAKSEYGYKTREKQPYSATYQSRALTAGSRQHCCPQLPTLMTCTRLATMISAIIIYSACGLQHWRS